MNPYIRNHIEDKWQEYWLSQFRSVYFFEDFVYFDDVRADKQYICPYVGEETPYRWKKFCFENQIKKRIHREPNQETLNGLMKIYHGTEVKLLASLKKFQKRTENNVTYWLQWY